MVSFEAVWHVKWRLLARIPRLGYGLLALDNDVFLCECA